MLHPRGCMRRWEKIRPGDVFMISFPSVASGVSMRMNGAAIPDFAEGFAEGCCVAIPRRLPDGAVDEKIGTCADGKGRRVFAGSGRSLGMKATGFFFEVASISSVIFARRASVYRMGRRGIAVEEPKLHSAVG